MAAVIKDFLMRVQHWISPLLGLLAILAGTQETWAQYNSDPYGSPGVARVAAQPAAYAGAHYAAPMNAYDQAMMSPEMYGGYPPAYTPVAYPFDDPASYGGMQPWPQISPFENGYQSQQVQDGIWKQITRGIGKRWYARAEYLSTRTRKPEGILGDTSTQSYYAQILRPWYSDRPNNANQGLDVEVDSGDGGGDDEDFTFPDAQPLGDLAQQIHDTNFYDRLDLHSLGDIFGRGVRVTGGWWNPDDSGFAAGFWTSDFAKYDFDSRKADATRVQPDLGRTLDTILFDFDFSDVNTIGELVVDLDIQGADFLSENLLNLRGLPVNDGSEEGIVIPYDLYFRVVNRSKSIGANLSHYFTPIVSRKNLRVRPLLGARWLNVDEQMEFVGVDSGLLYIPEEIDDEDEAEIPAPWRDLKSHSAPNAYDDDGDTIVDNAGSVELPGGSGGGGGDGGGGDGGGSGGSTGAFFYTGFAHEEFTPTLSFVDMTTKTNLYGPEFGFNYDLGSERFRISGETKFGLMVNQEKIKLRGDNIGSITRSAYEGFPVAVIQDGDSEMDDTVVLVGFFEDDPGLFTPTAGNPHPNYFEDEESHTHVSPMFEQSIFAEMRIFSYVPVLKDIAIFDRANFRLGYTFIWANQIATTNQSIVWDGKPTAGLFPHISVDRETWWTSNYSFGVSWDF